MTHGSLFSGIGGFELAAAWCGWENVFEVEKDKFCRKVLEKNFLEVTRYEDIFDFDGKKYRGKIDVISGGFPCQPFSVAGKRKGKEDDRHLWPEMLRVISEIRPSWVVGENVAGIINMALDDVLSSLEAQGYTAQAVIIPACAVGAPHRRDRVWIIANDDEINGNITGYGAGKVSQLEAAQVPRSNSSSDSAQIHDGRNRRIKEERQIPESGEGAVGRDASNTGGAEWTERGKQQHDYFGERQIHAPKQDDGVEIRSAVGSHDKPNRETAANAINQRLQRGERTESFQGGREIAHGSVAERNRNSQWNEHWLEAATRLCTLDDGLPQGMVRPKRWRVNALKAGGNAIVPQVAYEIFKAIDFITKREEF